MEAKIGEVQVLRSLCYLFYLGAVEAPFPQSVHGGSSGFETDAANQLFSKSGHSIWQAPVSKPEPPNGDPERRERTRKSSFDHP